MHSLEDAIDIYALWLSGLNHWLVVNGEVVNDVWILVVAAIHALETCLGDVSNLITVGRVIGHHSRVSARDYQ